MGNVRLLITAISSVVIFTIVLVAANTMAMSIGKRREIGILKALGFRKSQVLALALAKSMLAVGGALIGSGAKLLFARFNMSRFMAGLSQRFM